MDMIEFALSNLTLVGEWYNHIDCVAARQKESTDLTFLNPYKTLMGTWSPRQRELCKMLLSLYVIYNYPADESSKPSSQPVELEQMSRSVDNITLSPDSPRSNPEPLPEKVVEKNLIN